MSKKTKYFAGIVDHVLRSGWRGEIVSHNDGHRERICYVYGKTLTEMRKRKHFIAKQLNKAKK